MPRRGVYALVAVAVLALAGCGEGTELVEAGEAPPSPYSGPLQLPVQRIELTGDEEPNPEQVMIMAGAAGQALECDGEIYHGGGSEPWSEQDGGETPEEGLALHWSINGEDPPDYRFRVEKKEDGRVLYSFDVDGRTKEAVIVAQDQPHRPGWGPETSASCNVAEFPDSVIEKLPYDLWKDRDGRWLPTTVITSSEGPAHCDWQEADFLTLHEGASGEGGRSYARDPDGVLPDSMLTVPYDGDARLPAEAADTGFRNGDRQLFTVEGDDSRVYVRTDEGVEGWALVKKGMGCA